LFGDVPWFGGATAAMPANATKGFIRGDFGASYLDNRPVSSILGDAIKWTLLINLIVFIIIYAIGIPAGVTLAKHKGKPIDRVLSTVLFIQYSLPVAWIGTMLIIFFTSNYYANWMDLFPPYGLGKIGPEYTLWARISDRAYHLALPVFCSVIGSFAYISMQMRGGMMTVLRQDYIRTAFAKGLSPNTIYWKHALRNSLIPIITIFSSFLPAMISGSVIIEFLFTIPGMGRISYESVGARNFPVLFTILMFSAILTMLGTLVSDILYAVTDPRISFTKKEG
jgi:peptide/nickel transport system permease protein